VLPWKHQCQKYYIKRIKAMAKYLSHAFFEACILLGLFWLFLFRFRNGRIHGISISKRTFLLKTEYPWRRWPQNYCLHTGGVPRRFSRQKFPKRTRILPVIPSTEPYSFHSVHSAIGSRLKGMIFRSFQKRNRSQKNTSTVYSDYSYSGIVPKERTRR